MKSVFQFQTDIFLWKKFKQQIMLSYFESKVLLFYILCDLRIYANTLTMTCYVCNSLLESLCSEPTGSNFTAYTKKCSDYVEVSPSCVYAEDLLLDGVKPRPKRMGGSVGFISLMNKNMRKREMKSNENATILGDKVHFKQTQPDELNEHSRNVDSKSSTHTPSVPSWYTNELESDMNSEHDYHNNETEYRNFSNYTSAIHEYHNNETVYRNSSNYNTSAVPPEYMKIVIGGSEKPDLLVKAISLSATQVKNATTSRSEWNCEDQVSKNITGYQASKNDSYGFGISQSEETSNGTLDLLGKAISLFVNQVKNATTSRYKWDSEHLVSKNVTGYQASKNDRYSFGPSQSEETSNGTSDYLITGDFGTKVVSVYDNSENDTVKDVEITSAITTEMQASTGAVTVNESSAKNASSEAQSQQLTVNGEIKQLDGSRDLPSATTASAKGHRKENEESLWPKKTGFLDSMKKNRRSEYYCYKLVVIAREGEQYTVRGCTPKRRACFTGNFRAVERYDCIVCEGPLCNAQPPISIFRNLLQLLGIEGLLLTTIWFM